MAVKNFSPELLKIFEAGSNPEKPFEFDAGSEKGAHALRWRLNSLRREMRKEKHWLLPVAEAVIFSVHGTKLIASPPDLSIQESLKKALEAHTPGITQPPPELKVITGKNTAIEDYMKGKVK